MKSLIVTLTAILFVIPCYPQQDSLWLEEKLGSELEISSAEDEDNYLPDYLEDILANPVNINTAQLNDLLRVPGMNNSDAFRILEYRKRSGRIFSLFELYTIENLNPLQLRNYFPYLCTDDKISEEVISLKSKTPTMKTFLRSRIVRSIQSKRGYTEGIYLGDEYKIYNRLKITSDKKYNFGILTEKDPGERDYLDHTSFYFQVKDQGIIKSFIAGDYNIEFGKGLVLWSPYGFSKTPASFNGYRPGRNSVPYLSTDEVKYFRGTALNLLYKNFELTAYYSSRDKDAALDSSNHQILTLKTDGYHRTKSELSRYSNIREVVYGFHFNFHSQYLSMGILYNILKTSLPFSLNEKYPSGNLFNHYSFTYSTSIKKLYLSGEAAYFNGTIAHLNSLSFDISDNIKAFIIFRDFPKKYFSLLSASAQKESGTYAGISVTKIPGSLNFYYDSYKLSGSSHIFPVEGNELFADYTINASSQILIRTRYKKNTRLVSDAAITSREINESITAELTYKISRSIKWKSRFDYSRYSESVLKVQEKGYAFYQEAVFALTKTIELYGRITFFDSQSYNSRIYQYEKDLTGVFSMNPLYDNGTRWYAGLNVLIMTDLKLQCRYSETYKPEKDSLGSGYNEIKGNLDNQFSLQLDLSL